MPLDGISSASGASMDSIPMTLERPGEAGGLEKKSFDRVNQKSTMDILM